MRLRIEGSDLPGASWSGYRGVRVGVQRGADVVDSVPGDAAGAVFEVEVETGPGPSGPDFGGPFVHGRPGDRFLYLVWTHAGDAGPRMFRRAKLMLAPVGELGAAGAVVGRVRLRDANGGPLCAAVRPPTIRWAPATAG